MGWPRLCRLLPRIIGALAVQMYGREESVLAWLVWTATCNTPAHAPAAGCGLFLVAVWGLLWRACARPS